ncbi:DUF6270 domain-containing protein [Castellaniella hirudinis]|uniref:DUF6270 domain-containing protein n=1 Tax=Castellaniella hirudinis TaxID=1144617 RepID=A0ABV8S0E5_9BURK
MKIFILGSCVSKDSLDFGEPGEFHLVEFIARSSIASIFSEKPFDDVFSERLTSGFQRRWVNVDIEKKFLDIISRSDFDVLLMDFIDERFNLLEAGPGKCCTVSAEFKNTDPFKDIPDFKIIKSGSDDFFRRWGNGWNNLVDFLRKNDKLHKLRLNKVLWAARTASGGRYKKYLSEEIVPDEAIEFANNTLNKMYSFVEKDLKRDQFFTYDEIKGGDFHKWGPAPFHYADDFYQQMIGKMRTLAKELS